jgi:acetoacetyl-CoA synthetase
MYIGNYPALHKWSVENMSLFWKSVWSFVDIISSSTYREVVDENIGMHEIPTWFEGAKLNFAQNLLRMRDERVAIISTGGVLTLLI